jgi:predicted DNA-binding transcriptional regulator YafY
MPKSDLHTREGADRRLLTLVAELKRGPRAVDDLAARLGVSWRQVYRYIDALGAQGWDVIRRKTPGGPMTFALAGKAGKSRPN